MGNDAFFKQTYDKRNPAYGYNMIEGLVEEDCVQALEQVIAEKLGVAGTFCIDRPMSGLPRS